VIHPRSTAPTLHATTRPRECSRRQPLDVRALGSGVRGWSRADGTGGELLSNAQAFLNWSCHSLRQRTIDPPHRRSRRDPPSLGGSWRDHAYWSRVTSRLLLLQHLGTRSYFPSAILRVRNVTVRSDLRTELDVALSVHFLHPDSPASWPTVYKRDDRTGVPVVVDEVPPHFAITTRRRLPKSRGGGSCLVSTHLVRGVEQFASSA